MQIIKVNSFTNCDATKITNDAMKRRQASFGFNTLRDFPASITNWVVVSYGQVSLPEEKDDSGKAVRKASVVDVVVLRPNGAMDNSQDHVVALWEFKSRSSNLTDKDDQTLWDCQTALPATADSADVVNALPLNKILTINKLTGYLTSLAGKKYPKDVIKWS